MAGNEKCCCCPTYARTSSNVRYWAATQETLTPFWSRGSGTVYGINICYSADKRRVLCGDGDALRYWILDTQTGAALTAFDVFGYLNATSNQIDTAILLDGWSFFQHDDLSNINSMAFLDNGTEVTRTQAFTQSVVDPVNQCSQYLYTRSASTGTVTFYAYDSSLNLVATLGPYDDVADSVQTSNGVFMFEQESDGGGGFIATTARLIDTTGVVWEQDFTETYQNPSGSLNGYFVVNSNERDKAGNAHLDPVGNLFISFDATGLHEYSIPSLSSYEQDTRKSLMWVNGTDFVIYKEGSKPPFGTYVPPRLAYWSAGSERWDIEGAYNDGTASDQGILSIHADEQRTVTQIKHSIFTSDTISTTHDNSDGSVLHTVTWSSGALRPRAFPTDLICIDSPYIYGVVRSGVA